jgi:hypothetical protein
MSFAGSVPHIFSIEFCRWSYDNYNSPLRLAVVHPTVRSTRSESPIRSIANHPFNAEENTAKGRNKLFALASLGAQLRGGRTFPRAPLIAEETSTWAVGIDILWQLLLRHQDIITQDIYLYRGNMILIALGKPHDMR